MRYFMFMAPVLFSLACPNRAFAALDLYPAGEIPRGIQSNPESCDAHLDTLNQKEAGLRRQKTEALESATRNSLGGAKSEADVIRDTSSAKIREILEIAQAKSQEILDSAQADAREEEARARAKIEEIEAQSRLRSDKQQDEVEAKFKAEELKINQMREQLQRAKSQNLDCDEAAHFSGLEW